MRKTRSKAGSVSKSNVAEDKPTIFERLLFGNSESGDYSEASDDSSASGSSVDSSHSGTTEEGTQTTDKTREQQRFDRELRARHRGACKAMTNGRYAKAIKTFEGILSELLDRYGESHPRVGAALHNVAVANLRAGQLGDAKEAIEEAVRIRKNTLGENNSKVADSLVEYGIILLSMKDYDQSLSVFNEALAVRQKEAQKAKDTEYAREALLKMAKIRHNIGCVKFELGQLEEAKKSYAEAIDQQKEAFGTWSTPFMIMTDTTKPGFLTMASTMCNKGYIDIEQENYYEAISTFQESLKIQKLLLEADNKLILGTLDNIGYSHCMRQEYEKALKIYEELCTLQQESYGEQSQRGWASSVRKIIFCQVHLKHWEPAFRNLQALDDYLRSKTKGKNLQNDLKKTHELMGDVNYQIFKFPSLAESFAPAIGCGYCTGEEIDLTEWTPKKPANGSKMSGHRMTYA